MIIGIPKEVFAGEARVAATPVSVAQLIDFGYQVAIESGAGTASGFTDEKYSEAGATIVKQAREIWSQSNIVLKVRAPCQHPDLQASESDASEFNASECDWLKAGSVLVSFIAPAQNSALLQKLASKQVSVIAVDSIPRISRAQKLDVLSSMANVSGYRAVIEAANRFDRFFAGQMTAAGKVPPAKIMVIGAGVAGLAAVATANSLGAIVRAFDTRLEAKQQIESMGAEFLELDFAEDGSGQGGYAKVMSDEFIQAEMALFAAQCKEVDIVISTALIPGKPAPLLITAEMVRSMKAGSVIVDVAAERGGNCELTQPGEVVEIEGVSIIGYTDLPSRLPGQSSQLYSTNIRHLMDELTPHKDGKIVLDMEDEVIRSATVVHAGKITWPPAPALPAALSPPTRSPAENQSPLNAVAPDKPRKRKIKWGSFAVFGLGAAFLLWMGSVAPADFMAHFTVFVLACFVGYQVVWKVTAALHTPLMSVTNAISGIIIIGALLQIGRDSTVVTTLAAISIIIASINICGGFLVTHRMLKMFRRDRDEVQSGADQSGEER